MLIKPVYVFILIFMSIAEVCACQNILDKPTGYDISKNGKIIVYIYEEQKCIRIKTEKKQIAHEFKDIAEIRDIKPNINTSISYDSKFITVGFNASESIYVIKVIEIESMEEVFETKATSSVWMGSSNNLIVIPNYGIDEIQNIPGLIIYSAEKNNIKIVAKQFLFTGKVKSGGQKIIADIMELNNNEPYFRTIVYDLIKLKEIK